MERSWVASPGPEDLGGPLAMGTLEEKRLVEGGDQLARKSFMEIPRNATSGSSGGEDTREFHALGPAGGPVGYRPKEGGEALRRDEASPSPDDTLTGAGESSRTVEVVIRSGSGG